MLERKYDKKNRQKYEQKRQEKYREYLTSKRESLNNIKKEQEKILYENYLSCEECEKLILNNSPRLWERKIEEQDFLSIRLGVGQILLKIKMSYPQEKFKMEDDDELQEIFNSIVENSRTIEMAPIIISFAQNNISAIISRERNYIMEYMKNLIIQFITFHSYEDLKIVIFTNKEHSKEWEYLKMLPHLFDTSKQVRFFADDYDDMNEISRVLNEELKNRISQKDSTYKDFPLYYLIITDDYKQIENLGFITDFLKQKNNFGFSLLCITEDLFQLPNECKTFIDIQNEKGIIYNSEIGATKQTEFYLDPLKEISFKKVSSKLANIPIRVNVKGTMSLPNNFGFLDMFRVGKIEQLNILDRWKNNDTTLSLKTPIGIDSKGMMISLDIHEKYHGPHGLIAGTTGSGKSEFIITYILSLAVNYHPDDVTFLLIDYKGGGLAGAFKKNDIQLPHLVGTITNIDTGGLQRSLTSIQSEMRRRQIMFNEARNQTDEGTIDIYKYQRLYHSGVVKKPISHLFIISDEFAELKQQQPDFMDELISVARIGRSLGVHLILATQKPSGVVNDQIKSNSKFGICLKVQDKSDSSDVIQKPDAAYLKKPGQFYLMVGNDEYYVLGQSGWAGASYIPSNIIKKKVDTSVEFISNIGSTIKRIDETVDTTTTNENKGEQLTNILRYICDLAKKEKISAENLWLDNIPENIFLKDVKNKYKWKKDDTKLQIVIGEFDDPFNQRQGIVTIDLIKRDNIVIYGNAESGKETLLSTIIYDTMINYSTEQIQFYIIDFGSEALKIFKKSPHVGDIVFLDDADKLEKLIEMIQDEVSSRKNILSDYNGDYNLYIQKGNKMPIIVVILNNYEVFEETYGMKDYDEILGTITREGSKSGVIFIFTASTSNAIRYRMLQNINKKIALQMNLQDDYYSIFDKKKTVPKIFGRGLTTIESDEIYEYQTAKICSHTDYNVNIEETINELNEKNPIKARPIPILPDVLTIQYAKQYLEDITKVPVGMRKDDLKIYRYDFTKNFMTIIASKDMINAIQYAYIIADEVKLLKNVNVYILDAEKVHESGQTLQEAFIAFFEKIEDDIEKNGKYNFCVIIGIDRFIKELDMNIDETNFGEEFEKLKNSGKYCFIIVDNEKRLNEHKYEEWFSRNISSEFGMWIGKGVVDQSLITSEYNMDNKCGNSYGYIIVEGEGTFVKLLGMEERGAQDG